MATPISDLTPKARRTRIAMIEAARTIFGRSDLAGITVMRVCDLAGIGRTSFYNYFDGIDALTQAVATELANTIKNEFDALHKNQPRGLHRLEKCLSMVLMIAKNDPETALLLTSLAQNMPSISNLLHEEITLELDGAALDGSICSSKDHIEALSRFLTISTFSISREIALGKIPNDQIILQTEFLLNVCRQN